MKLTRDASYVSRAVQWGDLRGMHKIETVEQMTPEYRDTIFKVVFALASTEFASVEQHQAFINRGPTAEDRFTQAQICADEAHQGMDDLRTLALFGPEGTAAGEKLLQTKMGEHMLEAFNLPFESWTDVALRIRSVLSDIRADYADKRVWVFTHQAVIMSFRLVIEGLDEAKLLEIDRDLPLGNCSLTTYRDRDGTLELESFGAADHLEAREVSTTHEQPHAPVTGERHG